MEPSSKPVMSVSRSQTQPVRNLDWLDPPKAADSQKTIAIFDQLRPSAARAEHDQAQGHKQPSVVDYPNLRKNTTPSPLHQGSRAHPTQQRPHAHPPSQTGGISPDIAALIEELTRCRSIRKGHTYGDVLIEGDGVVVQGNTYDDPKALALMADHNYEGRVTIAPSGKGHLFAGDQPIALMKLIMRDPVTAALVAAAAATTTIVTQDIGTNEEQGCKP